MGYRQICIVGLGYIGLPTAAVFASRAIKVVGVDTNTNIVETINRGEVHIVEPQLDIVLRSAVNSGYLTAVQEPQPSDVFVIAVPTPLGEDRQPDISHIRQAADSIAPHLTSGNLVILESTSPVGTTQQLCTWLAESRPDLTFPSSHSASSHDISVAYCPERVLPGQVLKELVENDRVVGGITDACTVKAISFYQHIVEGECVPTTAPLAEMTKLTENAFRDVNIAFANELSAICDETGLDVWQLIQLANRHPRVNILQPGVGVGGHCIAVDPWFLVSSAPEQTKLIQAARQTNDGKPALVAQKIREKIKLNGWKKLACLGLSFKPNVDDVRGSPALEVVRDLASHEEDLELLIVEPHLKQLPEILTAHAQVKYAPLDEAIQQADCIVALVRHDNFVRHFTRNNTTIPIVDFVNLFPLLQ